MNIILNVQAGYEIPVMMINHASSPLLETNTNLKVTKYIQLKRILLDSFPISMLGCFFFYLGLNFKMLNKPSMTSSKKESDV